MAPGRTAGAELKTVLLPCSLLANIHFLNEWTVVIRLAVGAAHSVGAGIPLNWHDLSVRLHLLLTDRKKYTN